jgi:hypothetical protein
VQEVQDYLKTICNDLHVTRGEFDEASYPETKASAGSRCGVAASQRGARAASSAASHCARVTRRAAWRRCTCCAMLAAGAARMTARKPSD